MPKTIVIGLGNPLVSDDAAGIVVVRRLQDELGEHESVSFAEAQVGGLRLMDVMVGFERAIVVDAMLTGGEPGELRTFTPDDLVTTRNTVSSHDTNLAVALEAGRIGGLALPREVRILGIEAVDVVTFAERLSPAVERAVPEAMKRVRAMLLDKPTLKIGIYFCTCGTIVSDVIDPEVVRRTLDGQTQNVFFKTVAYACSEEGKEYLEADLRQERPDRVVIAACSPRDHEPTFMRVLAAAGLNPYLMQMVNIREQVAWVTPDPQAACAKAARLVRAALARAPWQTALEKSDVEICSDVVVLGAGPAGLKAALAAAQAGRKAVLVERSSAIGGMPVRFEDVFPGMECGPCMMEPVMADALHGPLAANIEMLTQSEVTQVTGSYGNFTVQIRRSPRFVQAEKCVGCGECIPPCPVSAPNAFNCGLNERKAIDFAFTAALPNVPSIDPALCLHLKGDACRACAEACPVGAGTIVFDDVEQTFERTAGAVVIATGAGLFDCTPLENLGYGRVPGIVTSLEFERLVASNGPTGGKLTTAAGQPPGSVAIVHCVGSLDARHCDYCSGICCRSAFKFHHQLTRLHPGIRIYHLYKELAVAGKDDARLYGEARANPNAEFIRYANLDEVNLCGGEHGGPVVTLAERSLPVDLAVLCTAVVPGKDTARLAEVFDVALDEHGFFRELHGRLDAVRTSKKGVFLAGACQSPSDIQGAVTQGMAAAGEIFSNLVPGRRLELEPMTASVDKTRCAGCRTCIGVCPYRAISYDPVLRVAQVNELLCMGCGTCTATCPSGAMQARHFSNAAMLAEIKGMLA